VLPAAAVRCLPRVFQYLRRSFFLFILKVTHADSVYVNIDMTPVRPGENDAVVVDFGKKNME
jgi:hypothetical protein